MIVFVLRKKAAGKTRGTDGKERKIFGTIHIAITILFVNWREENERNSGFIR